MVVGIMAKLSLYDDLEIQLIPNGTSPEGHSRDVFCASLSSHATKMAVLARFVTLMELKAVALKECHMPNLVRLVLNFVEKGGLPTIAKRRPSKKNSTRSMLRPSTSIGRTLLFATTIFGTGVLKWIVGISSTAIEGRNSHQKDSPGIILTLSKSRFMTVLTS